MLPVAVNGAVGKEGEDAACDMTVVEVKTVVDTDYDPATAPEVLVDMVLP